jgi:hypothetical protein
VQQQTHPKVMTNMLKKVFYWSKVHLSEMTSYKIHTLMLNPIWYGVREEIFFIYLSFLDQILSAEFISKISKLFLYLGEN